jgi:hypothetical protein
MADENSSAFFATLLEVYFHRYYQTSCWMMLIKNSNAEVIASAAMLMTPLSTSKANGRANGSWRQ